LPIAACRDRAALAAADHRTLTAVATAGAVDAGIGWVTADVIRGIVSSLLPLLLRVPFLLPGLRVWTADRPTARWTADRVVQIRLSRLEEDFDEAIFAAAVAAQRLALALEAAGCLRRALLAASTLLFLLFAAVFAALAVGRNFVNRRTPEELPERRREERGEHVAAGTSGAQAPR
jgi:hypothetical protein